MSKIVGTSATDALTGTSSDTILGLASGDTITGATAQANQLLVDGSFESAPVSAGTWSHFSQVGGWKSDTGIEVWGKNFIHGASSGDKLVELDYDGRFSKVWQDVKTTAGEQLSLSLDTAMRPGTSAATNGINIFWNGQQVAHVAPNSTAWQHSEFRVVGTGGTDRLEFREDSNSNDSLGGLIDNVSLTSPAKGNLLIGGSGNDALVAGNNGDVLVGGGAKSTLADLTKLKLAEDVTAHVTFDGSGAGFHNTVGMYTYDASGQITGVKIIYSDLSSQGVQHGPATVDLSMKAGEHFGFFVAPNAYGQAGNADLLGRSDGHFALIDARTGDVANVNAGHEMKLAYVGADGTTTTIHTQFGTSLFSTNTNDNGDQFQHSKVAVDAATGKIAVQFEDLWAGGDQNFHDANFSVEIGKTNALMLAHDPAAAHTGGADNDILTGGTGDDTLLGGSGNDTLAGGLGHNTIFAGSGDDVIVADGGNDKIVGGAGFDTLDYSRVSGHLTVDVGHHEVSVTDPATGAVLKFDSIEGIEKILGNDTGMTIDTGSKAGFVAIGGAGQDVFHVGGSDVLTGGAGSDMFQWIKKDVAGQALTGHASEITDFQVGQDHLDFTDFLKGAGKTAQLSDVVHAQDTAQGTLVSAYANGHWHEVVMLDHVHTTDVGLLSGH